MGGGGEEGEIKKRKGRDRGGMNSVPGHGPLLLHTCLNWQSQFISQMGSELHWLPLRLGQLGPSESLKDHCPHCAVASIHGPWVLFIRDLTYHLI